MNDSAIMNIWVALTEVIGLFKKKKQKTYKVCERYILRNIWEELEGNESKYDNISFHCICA